jgi:hypothetical protein
VITSAKTFSVLEFAAVAGCSPKLAKEFLEHFLEAGVVEHHPDGWAATSYGLKLSRGLSLAAPEARAA